MVKLGKQRIDQTNLIKITSVNLAHQCQLLNNGIRHSKMPRDKLLRPGENKEIKTTTSLPDMPSLGSYIFRWNTFGADEMPKGMRLQQ